MACLKKLKIILLFSLIIRIIFIIIFNVHITHYKEGLVDIEGIIVDYKIKVDKIDITLKAKEKIKIFYYLKENEKITYHLGDKISLNCNLQKPNKNTNFNLFNYRNYLFSNKIYYTCTTKKINLISKNKNLLYKIKNIIIDRINENQAKQYLNLFILGKNELEEEVKTSYQNNGISHLFAISGMHITLFATILLFILKKIKYKKMIVFIFLIFYMFLTNYSISVIRSAIFFILINLNFKIKPTKLLLLIALIILSYNPFMIYNIGFLFSFIVSYTLLSLTCIKSIKNYFLKVLVVSFISCIVTTPIVINNFFQINLLSPIINIIFVPIISFIIFPLSLITFIIPKCSILLINILNILEYTSLKVSQIDFLNITLCHLNVVSFIIYYIIIVIILYYFNKHKYHIIMIYFLIILLHFIYPYVKNDYKIHFIDVGQGDSILITLPHNKNLLIDTGGKYKTDLSKTVLIPYMKSNGVSKLDYLILTHGDYDHMGEAINIVNKFKVDKVIFNCGSYNDLEKKLMTALKNKKIKYFSCIEKLDIGSNKLYFLNNGNYDNENDNSNIIYTKFNNYKFIFMGDASKKSEKDILAKYNISDITVLKVGHHGSKTSSSKDFINNINPKYSIISVGKNNRYSHPNKETLTNLECSKIYRTDIDGGIMFKIKNNKLEVKTCKS